MPRNTLTGGRVVDYMNRALVALVLLLAPVACDGDGDGDGDDVAELCREDFDETNAECTGMCDDGTEVDGMCLAECRASSAETRAECDPDWAGEACHLGCRDSYQTCADGPDCLNQFADCALECDDAWG